MSHFERKMAKVNAAKIVENQCFKKKFFKKNLTFGISYKPENLVMNDPFNQSNSLFYQKRIAFDNHDFIEGGQSLDIEVERTNTNLSQVPESNVVDILQDSKDGSQIHRNLNI